MLNLNTPNINWRLYLLPFFVALLPIILFFGIPADPSQQEQKVVNNEPNVRRIVIVIIDSLRESNVEEDMPELKKLSENSLYLPLDTCLANFTLPCVRNLLEGKEGSPVSAIHNFTGAKSNRSLLSTLTRKNWQIETYSDHTVGALYKHVSDITENLNTYEGTTLERDLKLIAKAKASLAENKEKQLLILHVPGTDKTMHANPVGGPLYRNHFRTVDDALKEVLDTLDFEKDFLFVSGDHGHNNESFHEKISVAFMKGPAFFELEKVKAPRLASLDLVFWLSFASNSGIIDGYEGRSFWLTQDNLNSQKLAFRNREIKKMKAGDLSGNTMDELLQSQEARAEKDALKSGINLLGILLLILTLLLVCLFPLPKWKGLDIAILSVSIFLGFIFVSTSWSAPTIIFGILLFTITLFFLFLKKPKIALFALVLFAIRVATTFFGIPISDHFTRGDGGEFVLTVYGSITCLSVLIGYLFFPGVLVSEEKEAGFDDHEKIELTNLRRKFRLSVVGISSLVGMLALSSGHFFYGSSANFFDVTFFVGALVSLGFFCVYVLENRKLPKLLKTRSHLLHLFVFISVVVLTQFTEIINWRWHSHVEIFLQTHSAVASAIVVFSFLYFFWSAKDKHAYYFRVLPFFLITFFYTMWAGLDVAAFSVALFPSLLLVSLFTLRGTTHSPYQNVLEEGFDAVLLFLGVYATTWLCVSGFDLTHVDFTYFDRYFPNFVSTLSTDAERFLFYAPLTFPKYFLPSLFPFFVFFLIRGVRLRVAFYVLGLFLIQITFMAADIVVSMSIKSVLVGFAIEDLAFVWATSLSTTIFLLATLAINSRKSASKSEKI